MLLSRSFDRRQWDCEIFGITKAAIARSKPESSRLWCSIRICIKELWCDREKTWEIFSSGRNVSIEWLSVHSPRLWRQKKHSRVKNHKESCRRTATRVISLSWVMELENNRSTKRQTRNVNAAGNFIPLLCCNRHCTTITTSFHSSVLFDHRFGRSHSKRLDFTRYRKEAVRTCNLINRERF